MDKANFGKLPGHKDSMGVSNPSKVSKTPAGKFYAAAKPSSPKSAAGIKGGMKGLGKGKGC